MPVSILGCSHSPKHGMVWASLDCQVEGVGLTGGPQAVSCMQVAHGSKASARQIPNFVVATLLINLLAYSLSCFCLFYPGNPEMR